MSHKTTNTAFTIHLRDEDTLPRVRRYFADGHSWLLIDFGSTEVTVFAENEAHADAIEHALHDQTGASYAEEIKRLRVAAAETEH